MNIKFLSKFTDLLEDKTNFLKEKLFQELIKVKYENTKS